jgi:ribonucleotide reductase alpha subunit
MSLCNASEIHHESGGTKEKAGMAYLKVHHITFLEVLRKPHTHPPTIMTADSTGIPSSYHLPKANQSHWHFVKLLDKNNALV